MSLFERKKKPVPKEVLSIDNTQITNIVAAVIANMEGKTVQPEGNKPAVDKPIKAKMSAQDLVTFSAHCADLGDSAILKECTDADLTFGESMNFLMAKVKTSVQEMQAEATDIKSDFNNFNPSVPDIELHKSDKVGTYASTMEGVPALAKLHKCSAKDAVAMLQKTQPELFANPYLRKEEF